MSDDQSNFQTALAQVLRPLARSMVSQSVTIAQATELLKQAYVSAVLETETASPTDSRISVLTGLHRKDVKRLRASDPRPPRRPMLNASALAVAVWTMSPEFTDAKGKPLPLDRTGSPGFDDLVKKARIDLPASTLLAALQEQGMITQPKPDGPYVLARGDMSGSTDLDAKLMAFEKNIAAHLEASADNLGADPAPHFERAAHFNKLSDASVSKLETAARQKLHTVLVELNDMALDLQDEDQGKDAKGRFSVGGYVHGKPSKDEGHNDA